MEIYFVIKEGNEVVYSAAVLKFSLSRCDFTKVSRYFTRERLYIFADVLLYEKRRFHDSRCAGDAGVRKRTGFTFFSA